MYTITPLRDLHNPHHLELILYDLDGLVKVFICDPTQTSEQEAYEVVLDWMRCEGMNMSFVCFGDGSYTPERTNA